MQLLNDDIKNIGKTAVSIIYPPRCPVCDEIVGVFDKDRLVHVQCRKKISYISGNTCMKCGKPLSGKDADLFRRFAVAVRDLVHEVVVNAEIPDVSDLPVSGPTSGFIRNV